MPLCVDQILGPFGPCGPFGPVGPVPLPCALLSPGLAVFQVPQLAIHNLLLLNGVVLLRLTPDGQTRHI